jgi:hypothetical protein
MIQADANKRPSIAEVIEELFHPSTFSVDNIDTENGVIQCAFNPTELQLACVLQDGTCIFSYNGLSAPCSTWQKTVLEISDVLLIDWKVGNYIFLVEFIC